MWLLLALAVFGMMVVGAVTVVWPLRRLGLTRRWHGAVLLFGALLAAGEIGRHLPPGAERPSGREPPTAVSAGGTVASNAAAEAVSAPSSPPNRPPEAGPRPVTSVADPAPEPTEPTPAVAAPQPPEAWAADGQISVEEYEALCAAVPSDIYRERCRGRTVVWRLFITSVEGRRAFEASTLPQGGRRFDIALAAPFTWEGELAHYVGRPVVVRARIDSPSGYAHDLAGAQFVLVDFTDAERAAMAEAARAEAERVARSQAAEAERATRGRAAVDAMTVCRAEFRRRVRFPETIEQPFFDRYAAEQWEGNRVTIQAGPTARNAFNVPQRYIYQCAVEGGRIVRFALQEAP